MCRNSPVNSSIPENAPKPFVFRVAQHDAAAARFIDGLFCTDALVDVRDILETVAARWAIDEHRNAFWGHDVKEIWGSGQQQVRNIWSNIGCRHLSQWMYTLVELCSWDVVW